MKMKPYPAPPLPRTDGVVVTDTHDGTSVLFSSLKTIKIKKTNRYGGSN
jgi:hypothetical protein